jgi:hypothetical protein
MGGRSYGFKCAETIAGQRTADRAGGSLASFRFAFAVAFAFYRDCDLLRWEGGGALAAQGWVEALV